MRIVVSEFISLDGVVQAPGGPDEDTDGGFAHGGWSTPLVRPRAMGGSFDAALSRRRPPVRPAHLAGDGGGVARTGR